MENQRNPQVSRLAAKEAAERLRLLALLLKDEDTLTRILSEADRTIARHRQIARLDDRPDDCGDLMAWSDRSGRLFN